MLPKAIQDLADNFQKFPGVGFKSSQKLALDVLQMKEEDYQDFFSAISQIRESVKFCDNCGFFAQKKLETEVSCLCEICKNPTRKPFTICLVEKPTDVITLEKADIFNGQYQVLENLISPLENIYPENTKIGYFFNHRISKLLESDPELKIELILFFKAGFAAEATTAYIRELIKEKSLEKNIILSKLAEGLPLYYNPDTLDQATMAKALEDRRTI
jgi:recombination protein RecR